jgi:hypothetical protein
VNGLIRTASAALLAVALSTSAEAQTLFRGLDHTALDGAVLSLPPSGKLKVSNLGSSGCDGVSIAVTETEQCTIEFDPLIPTNYPGTAGFQLEAFGELATVPDQSLARFETTRSGQEWQTTPHYSSMGASSYTVEVYDQGALVHQDSGRADGSPAFKCRIVASAYLKAGIRCCPLEVYVEACISLGTKAPVTVVGGPTVLGDMIIVRSDDGGATTGSTFSHVELTATDLTTMDIADESIHVFGSAHSGIDDARLDPSGGTLVVSNIGSSGCDGVSIAPGPSDGFEVQLEELSLTGPPQPGDYIEFQTTGTVNGVPDSPAGSVRLTQTQTGVDITTDNSALGSPGVRIEVFDDGVSVVSIPCALSATVSVPAWPTGGNKRKFCFPDGPCQEFSWPVDLFINIPGSGTFFGDQMTLTAETPAVVLESITGISIIGKGNPLRMRIMGEQRTELPGYTAYCVTGTSANGCQAQLSSTGTASASASSGFVVTAALSEGDKDGLFFYGQNGRQQNPWGSSSSFQCVVTPVQRGGLQPGSGTSGVCDGGASQDLNARWCPSCPKPTHNPTVGTPMQIQYWYRDPFNTSNQTTSLSHAIEVVPQP